MKVFCTPLTKRIECAKVSPKGIISKTRYDVTETDLEAVADFLIKNDCAMQFDFMGEAMILSVTKETPNTTTK